MTDPTNVHYDDLVTAFATLGIEIDTTVKSVRITPDRIIIERYRRTADGKNFGYPEPVMSHMEIALGYERPATCTCQWADVTPEPCGPRELIRGALDPACPQHGGAA